MCECLPAGRVAACVIDVCPVGAVGTAARHRCAVDAAPATPAGAATAAILVWQLAAVMAAHTPGDGAVQQRFVRVNWEGRTSR